MKFLLAVIASLISGALCSPFINQRSPDWQYSNFDSSYDSFSDPNGFYSGGVSSSLGTYAGPAMAFANPFYGPAAFAAAGPGIYPPVYPMPMMNPFFPFYGFSMPQPWYLGPNVCKETVDFDEPQNIQDFMNDPDLRSQGINRGRNQVCDGNEKVHMCTTVETIDGKRKKKVTKYRCCVGFKNVNDGLGCVETDIKDLIPTLRDLKAEKFVQLLDRAGLADLLHDENFTVFCPPEENLSALESAEEEEEQENNNFIMDEVEMSNAINSKLRKVMTSHITEGFLFYDEIEDRAIIPTENEDADIRLDIYYIPDRLMTANCVPVTSYNHYARNGIIHMIDKVLPIPTRSVADIIASDPQFSILKGLLSKAGLVQALRNPTGNFTIFAPTDSAFEHEPEPQPGSTCASSLMRNHILEYTICSSAIPNYAQSMNMLGELLSLTREVDNKIYVDEVQIVVKDIVGTNGVVHIIDGLLLPRKAKTLTRVLKETRLRGFLELLEMANLTTFFDSIENVTFFVPSNEAIREIPKNQMEQFVNNADDLSDMLLYHTAGSKFTFSTLGGSKLLPTLNEDSNIRIQQYITYPYATKKVKVQCANVLSSDNQLCGSVLHVVDKFLHPSKRTVMHILHSTPILSRFAQIVRAAGLDHRLNSNNESFTVLAPTNHVFDRDPYWFDDTLQSDIREARDFVKRHVLSETLCCNQLRHKFIAGQQQARTLDGSLLRIESTMNPMSIGEARILSCDDPADNGVVHSLNNIVYSLRSTLNGPVYRDPSYHDR